MEPRNQERRRPNSNMFALALLQYSLMLRRILRFSGFFFMVILGLLLLVSWTGILDFKGNLDKVNRERKSLGLAPLQSRTVQVGDRILYTVMGGDTTSRTALLFLHGSPGAWNASEPYLNDTSLQRYLLLAPDRPGFGESDFGEALPSLAGQSLMVRAMMDRWPGRRFVVIGHSYGCSLAQQLAFDDPDRVAAVVHVAPPLDPDLEVGIGWRKFLDFPLFHLVTPPAFRVCNQELITLKEDLELLLPQWSTLRVPTYLIQGAADKLVFPEEMDFFQKMAPEPMQKVYPHPGDHFIYWTDVPFVRKVIGEALEVEESTKSQIPNSK